MLVKVLIVALILACVALIVRRIRATGLRPAELRGHLRARGWGLLAIPLAVQYAMLTTQRATSLVEVLAGIAIVVFAPRLATIAVPFGLMILGWWGIVLVRDFDRGGLPTVLYGLALSGGGSWPDRLVLPEAALFTAAGAWLFLRVRAPGSGQVRALFGYAAGAVAGRPSRWARLLLPVLALTVEVLGLRFWLGQVWWTLEWTVVATVALAVGGVFLVRRAPTVAAILAATGLQILGLYGIILGAVWTATMPLQFFGVVSLNGQFDTRVPAIGQGLVLLATGAYLMPRVIREHIAGAPDRELAALTERVETLTLTRTEATDAAAAELRRIERDLHDGAQARLVALGMSLRAAERLFASNPDAALALVSEARETSSRALSRPARPGPRHLPAGPGRPRAGRRGPGPGPGHPAVHPARRGPARRGGDAGRRGRLLRGRRGAGQRGPPLRCPHGPHPYRPPRRHAAGRGHRRRRGRRRSRPGHRPGRSGAQAGDV